MRIAHVTISHEALDVRVFHKECRTLASAGHEVHLLVPGTTPVEADGVRFHSLPEVGTTTAYLWRVWRKLPQIYRMARGIGADVYHMPDPALVPLGLALKLRGARVIYDAHEDRPKQARTKYLALRRPLVGAITSAIWRLLEAVARATFDRFVAATPAIAERFPAGRTVTIRNFPRLEEFAMPPDVRALPYSDRPNHVVYAGGIHPYLGISEAVQAMSVLPAKLDAQLILMGDFARAHPKFQDDLKRLTGWQRVVYLGRLPRPDMVARLAASRVGLALMRPRPELVLAMGNKTFEYMAAGIPVVASDFPVWRQILGDGYAGLTVDPLDPAQIAAAIGYLLQQPADAEAMGERGRNAVASRYNWESEAAELLSLYSELEHSEEVRGHQIRSS